MKLPDGFKIEVKDDEFFEQMKRVYGWDINMYKDGDTFYVTQEVFDRLKDLTND